jgi:UDP-N-acetylglucosamine--N-acetylmuramyl-(pentapeptide) pyrophosphoryl-undecaprenol N-acetylglucosamine transferase
MSTRSASGPILIAGGGTGGHVFPAIAVADAIRAVSDVDVVFAGAVRGLETRLVPARGYTLEVLRIEPMTGGGVGRAVRGGIIAAKATAEAARLVRRLRPRAVLSVGGYAAGPVALAAAALGAPVAVFEPNSVVGLTNRLLAPLARRAYVAFDEAGASFRRGAVRRLGVPLRDGFVPRPYVAGGSARVFVIGGSQGALALNERLPVAIARARGELSRIEVVHQTGAGADETVRDAYRREGVSDAVVTPFLDDVAGELSKADLVVARAGAGTIAEITAIGRASLLVPFPHAAGDHQAKNAEALARAGGAVAIRQEAADATRIAAEIVRLLGDDAARVAMANAARAHGRPTAARDVALDLLDLAGVAVDLDLPKRRARYTNGASHRSPNGVH